MLFSSLAATLSGLGLGAYAAANRYLDALVAMTPERAAVPLISVAWDDWDFEYGGQQQAAYARTRSRLSIAPEGIAAIEAILGEPCLDRVLVAATPLEQRLSALDQPTVCRRLPLLPVWPTIAIADAPHRSGINVGFHTRGGTGAGCLRHSARESACGDPTTKSSPSAEIACSRRRWCSSSAGRV